MPVQTIREVAEKRGGNTDILDMMMIIGMRRRRGRRTG